MRTVLLVDDEPLVREAIRRLGDWTAFDVGTLFEAGDAVRALEILDAPAPIDLVITDMKMPEMDGRQFLRELDLRGRRWPVVVLSGFDDYEYTRQAIRSQVVDYILKPVDAEDLHLALSSVFGGSGPTQRPSAPSPRLARLLEFLNLNYRQPLTLDELASRFASSREHLSRSFKKEMGVNLFDYISELRLAEAKRLLRTTDRPIKSIAFELGFQDEHYFSKAFRRLEGVSPSDFRLSVPDQ